MTTLHIPANELTPAIKRVSPHASVPAQNVPILETIRFTVKGEQVILSACDRYTICETRVRLLDRVDSPVEFLVNAKQLKALLPAIKHGMVTVEVDPDDTAAGATFNGARVPGDEMERYPATQNLWPDTFEEVAASNFAVSAAAVKKLTALPQGRHESNIPLVFGQGKDAHANKPFVVLFGEGTRVLVMPSRISTAEYPHARYASWSVTLPPAEEDDSAAA